MRENNNEGLSFYNDTILLNYRCNYDIKQIKTLADLEIFNNSNVVEGKNKFQSILKE